MITEEIFAEVIASANEAARIHNSENDKTVILYENDNFIVWLVNSARTLQEALRVMREGFYPHESICNGVRLGEDLKETDMNKKFDEEQVSGERGVDELEMLTLETAKDGISLLAVEKATNKVAGAAFNKIQKPCGPGEKGFFESFRDEHCKSMSAIALIDSMIEVDSHFDVFEHYKVSSVLEVMFLATIPSFRGRGVGTLLMRASFEAASQRGVPIVAALMTSIYTQRIARSVGMEELSEVDHKELTFLGEPIAVRTGIHKSTILVAKKIQCV